MEELCIIYYNVSKTRTSFEEIDSLQYGKLGKENKVYSIVYQFQKRRRKYALILSLYKILRYEISCFMLFEKMNLLVVRKNSGKCQIFSVSPVECRENLNRY